MKCQAVIVTTSDRLVPFQDTHGDAFTAASAVLSSQGV